MAETEQDTIGKLPFTAVAAPDPEVRSGTVAATDLHHYSGSDNPAAQKEIFSYYAYYAGNNGIGSFQ